MADSLDSEDATSPANDLSEHLAMQSDETEIIISSANSAGDEFSRHEDDVHKQSRKWALLLEGTVPSEIVSSVVGQITKMRTMDVDFNWLEIKLNQGEVLPAESGGCPSVDYTSQTSTDSGLNYLQPGLRTAYPKEFTGAGAKGILHRHQSIYCITGPTVHVWAIFEQVECVTVIHTQDKATITWVVETEIPEEIAKEKQIHRWGLILATAKQVYCFGRPLQKQNTWEAVWAAQSDYDISAIISFKGKVIMGTSNGSLQEVQSSASGILWGSRGFYISKLISCPEVITNFKYDEFHGLLYGISVTGAILTFKVDASVVLLISNTKKADIISDGSSANGNLVHISILHNTSTPTLVATTDNLTRFVLSLVPAQDNRGLDYMFKVIHMRRPFPGWAKSTVTLASEVKTSCMLFSLSENSEKWMNMIANSSNFDLENWIEDLSNLQIPFKLLDASCIQVDGESRLNVLMGQKLATLVLLTKDCVYTYKPMCATAMTLSALKRGTDSGSFKKIEKIFSQKQILIALLEVSCLTDIPYAAKQRARAVFIEVSSAISENSTQTCLEALLTLISRVLTSCKDISILLSAREALIGFHTNNSVKIENIKKQFEDLLAFVNQNMTESMNNSNELFSKCLFFMEFCSQVINLLNLLNGVRVDEDLPNSLTLNCSLEELLSNEDTPALCTRITEHIAKYFVSSPASCKYEAMIASLVDNCPLIFARDKYYVSLGRFNLVQASQESDFVKRAKLISGALTMFTAALQLVPLLPLEETCRGFLAVNGIAEIVTLCSQFGSATKEEKSYDVATMLMGTLYYGSLESRNQALTMMHYVLLSMDQAFEAALFNWLDTQNLLIEVLDSTVLEAQAEEELEKYLLQVLQMADDEDDLNKATKLLTWLYNTKMGQPARAIEILKLSAEVPCFKITIQARIEYIKQAMQLASDAKTCAIGAYQRKKLDETLEVANLQIMLLAEALKSGCATLELKNSLMSCMDQLTFSQNNDLMESELLMLQKLELGEEDRILELWTKLLQAATNVDAALKRFEHLSSQLTGRYLPVHEVVLLLEEMSFEDQGQDTRVLHTLLKVVDLDTMLDTYRNILLQRNRWRWSLEQILTTALVLVQQIFVNGKMQLHRAKASQLVTLCEEVMINAEKLPMDPIFELLMKVKQETELNPI